MLFDRSVALQCEMTVFQSLLDDGRGIRPLGVGIHTHVSDHVREFFEISLTTDLSFFI